MKKRIAILIPILFLVLTLGCLSPTRTFAAQKTSSVSSKVLYVSPRGKDSNSGSRKRPLRTIQRALDLAKAGTTIYLAEGNYAEKVTFPKSGTASGWIVLTAENGAKASLTLGKGESGAILDLNGQSYIEISNLEIGNASADRVYGILLGPGCKHIRIANNDIHNIETLYPEDPTKGEANGILLFGEGKTKAKAISQVVIEKNLLHDNVNGWSENISVSSNCEKILIRNNKVYRNTNIGIDLYGNAGYCSREALDQPRNCTISGNTVYQCKSTYADCAGIYVDGARDCLVEKNICYLNAYGIEIGSEEGENHPDYPVRGIRVRNNTVYHNTHCGIRIGGYDPKDSGWVKNCSIFGNTFRNNGKGKWGWDGELNLAMSQNITVSGNHFYKSSNRFPMIASEFNDQPYRYEDYVKGIRFSNNVFYSPDSGKIHFELKNRSICGIKQWKKLAPKDRAKRWK